MWNLPSLSIIPVGDDIPQINKQVKYNCHVMIGAAKKNKEGKEERVGSKQPSLMKHRELQITSPRHKL